MTSRAPTTGNGPSLESPKPTFTQQGNHTTDNVRRLKPMRQIDRVRAMLAGWTCAVDFVNAEPPILAYSPRIFDLRRQGYVIERRRCANPYHRHRRDSSMYEWKIASRPGERP